jgi:hypothetical protein
MSPRDRFVCRFQKQRTLYNATKTASLKIFFGDKWLGSWHFWLHLPFMKLQIISRKRQTVLELSSSFLWNKGWVEGAYLYTYCKYWDTSCSILLHRASYSANRSQAVIYFQNLLPFISHIGPFASSFGFGWVPSGYPAVLGATFCPTSLFLMFDFCSHLLIRKK